LKFAGIRNGFCLNDGKSLSIYQKTTILAWDKMWTIKKKALNVHSEPFFDALLALKKIVIMKNPTTNSAIQSLPAASFCVIGSELF
jgi:hypothetical protein